MKIDDLIAIDVHTHAEISCRLPEDDYANEIEDQKRKYFKSDKGPPTIQETIAYYRERKIGLVMFTVDTEFEIGRRRIPNEEVAEAARANSDIMIAFGSVDPHKGKMGLREVKALIDGGIGGFKFHPTCQGFYPNDRLAYPYYELMAAAKLPVVFHSGHSGMGSGLRGGGGLRLKYSNPMHLDDVAADFPDMTIIIAHPSWPWQDEALSVCLHKPNVYIDLSGWSPKYFPPQLIHYANTQLKSKVLFGTDYPLITPERWMSDFDAAGFRPEVKPLILKANAIRALGLDR